MHKKNRVTLHIVQISYLNVSTYA